jgi:hypothetical protein
MRLAGLWLIYLVWCQVSGWALSGLGVLGASGYLMALPIGLAAAIAFWRATRPVPRHSRPGKAWRRLRKSPESLAWVGVTFLILLGGLLHPPSNYDGVTYRLPKLLYWLQAGRWHWIDGIDFRLNITGAGWEWSAAPWLLLTHSDRGLFLLNFLPFLLLPGLFFVAARGLGLPRRTARWWMWIWPMAFGIAVQAASIGNDMVCAALALASLAFAARAERGQPGWCLALSALAATLMTAIKATALPLGLPLAVFWLYSSWRLLGPRRLLCLGGAITPLALLASFFPMAVLCWQHTGRWNGNPGDRYGFEPKHPAAALVGNSIQFGTSLIEPPAFPTALAVNRWVADHVTEAPWFVWTKQGYPCFVPPALKELPTEELSGIGLGLTLVGISWWFRRKPGSGHRLRTPLATAFVAGLALAFLAFMLKSGVGGTSRLLVPFTPLLILGFLMVTPRCPRRWGPSEAWWKLLPALFLLPTLLLNSNRPLVPAGLLAGIPGLPAGFKNRLSQVYGTYARRSTLLTPLTDGIPPGETIGFAGGGNHSAVGLFKPYFTRKVLNLSPRTEGAVNWIVANQDGFEQRMGTSLEAWERSAPFQRVAERSITSLVATGPEIWIVYARRGR